MNLLRYSPEKIQVGDRDEKGTTIDGNNITQRKLIQKQKINVKLKCCYKTCVQNAVLLSSNWYGHDSWSGLTHAWFEASSLKYMRSATWRKIYHHKLRNFSEERRYQFYHIVCLLIRNSSAFLWIWHGGLAGCVASEWHVEEDFPAFEMLSVNTLVKNILIKLQLLRWKCERDGERRTGYLICIFWLASDLFEEMFTVCACLSSQSSLKSTSHVKQQREICIW
jgi:hypothetical protein